MDAFVIVGGPRFKVDFALEAIIQRLKMALNGVPPETRAATFDGKTVFSRPRPGAARMYPETDVPSIPINSSRIASLSEKIPKSMDEILSSLAKKYRLNKKLAEQIFDSDYFSIFEEIVGSVKEVSPTFIASKLTEDMINLERRGLDRAVITDELLTDIFKRLDTGTIAKESVISIFEKLMKKEAGTVEDAKMALGITSISDQELDTAIEEVLKENMSIIIEKRFEAVGILMGRSMALLRGRADGHKINSILMKKLEYLLMRANSSGASPSAPV